MFENSIWLLSKVEKKQHQNKRQYVQLSKCHTSKRIYTVSLSLSLSRAPAALLLFAVRPTVCSSCFAPLFSIKMSHRCPGGTMLKRADHRRGDKRARRREHWIQLTCCSVQDLGLEEYAGVLVFDAGEEQPLRLHGTPRHYDLQKTRRALLVQWTWTNYVQKNPLHIF